MARYRNLDELLNDVARMPREKLRRIYKENEAAFLARPGSKHNHQAWAGGYLDHVTEVLNIARMLYPVMNEHRQLPFTMSDAFIALFLHDVEKLFPQRIELKIKTVSIPYKEAQASVRMEIINEYELWPLMPEAVHNAIKYAEGEKDDYSNERRVSGPLANFVHICDVTSARIWFDRPLLSEKEETWGRRIRLQSQ